MKNAKQAMMEALGNWLEANAPESIRGDAGAVWFMQNLSRICESALAALPSAEGPTCAVCSKPARHNCPRLGDAAGWVHAHDGSHLCAVPGIAPTGVLRPAPAPTPPSEAERAERADLLSLQRYDFEPGGVGGFRCGASMTKSKTGEYLDFDDVEKLLGSASANHKERAKDAAREIHELSNDVLRRHAVATGNSVLIGGSHVDDYASIILRTCYGEEAGK